MTPVFVIYDSRGGLVEQLAEPLRRVCAKSAASRAAAYAWTRPIRPSSCAATRSSSVRRTDPASRASSSSGSLSPATSGRAGSRWKASRRILGGLVAARGARSDARAALSPAHCARHARRGWLPWSEAMRRSGSYYGATAHCCGEQRGPRAGARPRTPRGRARQSAGGINARWTQVVVSVAGPERCPLLR